MFSENLTSGKKGIRYRQLLAAVFLFFLAGMSLRAGEAEGVETNEPVQPGQKHPARTKEDSVKAVANLKYKIDMLLANKCLNNASYAVGVYSLDKDSYLYAKNIDKLLTPASTTKLFWGFSSLMSLGPDFLVKTQACLEAQAGSDGVVRGNVYLVGHGDALLSISDLERLAEELHRHGVTKIEGNICADGSYFDGVTDRVKYSGDREVVEPVGPVSALSIQKNEVTVLVSSGSIPGKHVNVQIVPANDAFVKIVNATVSGGGRKVKKKSSAAIETQGDENIENEIDADNYEIMAGDQEYPDLALRGKKSRAAASGTAGISVQTRIGEDGRQVFIISGTLPPNQTRSYAFPIRNPEIIAAGTFKERLEAVGIKVTGKVISAALPDGKGHVLGEFGRPLSDLLMVVNKFSNNYIAEHVFKILGAQSGGHKDNGSKSREVFRKLNDSMHLKCASCRLNDGSGLSRRNAVTAESMIRMLSIAKKSRISKVLDTTLSIAGVDGTLRRRMRGTFAENNLHAKTGTLRDVSALAGYVRTRTGENLAFSFMFNGPGVGYYKMIENELGALIANFDYSLPASGL